MPGATWRCWAAETAASGPRSDKRAPSPVPHWRATITQAKRSEQPLPAPGGATVAVCVRISAPRRRGILTLKVSNLAKRFPDGLVFEKVSFVLNPGEKVGLVGPNGSGKSTLLKVIAGRLSADAGAVSFGPGDHFGYLEQYPEADLGRAVGEALTAANPEMDAARTAMARAGETLSAPGLTPEGQEAALSAYGEAAERFER